MRIFPKDDSLFNIMRSDEFKKLLATDASTIEGKDFIAGYYGINNWVQLEEKRGKNGLIQDQADSYFFSSRWKNTLRLDCGTR